MKFRVEVDIFRCENVTVEVDSEEDIDTEVEAVLFQNGILWDDLEIVDIEPIL